MLQMNAHFSLRKGVKLRKENFGAIIFTPEWMVYTVNHTGCIILNLLINQNLTLEKVIKEFMKAFPEESNNMPDQIQKFVAQSLELGVIIPVHAQNHS